MPQHFQAESFLFPALWAAPIPLSVIGNGFGDAALVWMVWTLFAAIVSIPMGALFGLVFWSGIAPVEKHMANPAHDLLTHAWVGGATMLFAAAGLALVISVFLEGPYCYGLFFEVMPALGIVPPPGTDAGWTRFLVLPAPFLLAGVGFVFAAWRARRSMAHTMTALGKGTHPRWALGDLIAQTSEQDSVLPLRAVDRTGASRVAVHLRGGGSPYRDAPVIAFVGNGEEASSA